MKWKTHQYYAESDAGYRISKAMTAGVAVYTAWAPLPPKDAIERGVNFSMLECSLKPKTAAQFCEEHYAKQTAAEPSGGLADEVNNGSERDSIPPVAARRSAFDAEPPTPATTGGATRAGVRPGSLFGERRQIPAPILFKQET
jgi:hypothetical protein